MTQEDLKTMQDAINKAVADGQHPTLDTMFSIDPATGKLTAKAAYVNKDKSMEIDAGLENDKVTAGIKVNF